MLIAVIVINGRRYEGNNVQITGNKVVIDGKTQDLPDEKHINITVEGDATSVKLDNGEITVNGRVGTLTSHNGNVNVDGDVEGNVTTTNGNVKCVAVFGDANTVNGNIKTTK